MGSCPLPDPTTVRTYPSEGRVVFRVRLNEVRDCVRLPVQSFAWRLLKVEIAVPEEIEATLRIMVLGGARLIWRIGMSEPWFRNRAEIRLRHFPKLSPNNVLVLDGFRLIHGAGSVTRDELRTGALLPEPLCFTVTGELLELPNG